MPHTTTLYYIIKKSSIQNWLSDVPILSSKFMFFSSICKNVTVILAFLFFISFRVNAFFIHEFFFYISYNCIFFPFPFWRFVTVQDHPYTLELIALGQDNANRDGCELLLLCYTLRVLMNKKARKEKMLYIWPSETLTSQNRLTYNIFPS